MEKKSRTKSNEKNHTYTLIENAEKLKPMEKCEIIRHFQNHGDFINQVMVFCKKCKYMSTRNCDIKTQCGTTSNSLINMLTHGIRKTNPLVVVDSSGTTAKFMNDIITYVEDVMTNNELFGLAIPSNGNFPGHILNIYKLNHDLFVVIQSYVGAYSVLYNIGTFTQIIQFITNYIRMYDLGQRKQGLRQMWFNLTGVQLNLRGNDNVIPPSPLNIILYNMNKTGNCADKLIGIYTEAIDKIRLLIRKYGKNKTQDIEDFSNAFVLFSSKVTLDDLIYISMKIEDALLHLINQEDVAMQVGTINSDGFPIINYI